MGRAGGLRGAQEGNSIKPGPTPSETQRRASAALSTNARKPRVGAAQSTVGCANK